MKISRCIFLIFNMCLFYVFVCGCVPQNNTQTSTPGIVAVSGIESYVVKIPAGTAMEDYFNIPSHKNTIVISRTDVSTYFQNEGSVYYWQEEKGNWIGYYGDIFMYIPADVGESSAKNAYISLPLKIGNYMTIEEAANYIF